MGLDYKAVKACSEAQEVLAKYCKVVPKKLGDRTFELRSYNCLVVYSQQETTIYPCDNDSDYYGDYIRDIYPEGVGRTYFKSPFKEYVHFRDSSGKIRYYLTHERGLRIQRDGDGFKAMNPIQDYHVEIDRVKAKIAREPAEDLYRYIEGLWDMIPDPGFKDRPWDVPDILPGIDDRESWHAYVVGCKWARYKSISKSTVLARIRKECIESELAYSVSLVPDTRTDHGPHWSKIGEIRAAGMLKEFEEKDGSIKKKRVEGKTAKAGTA